MSFVFSDFLASFPLFFIFREALLSRLRQPHRALFRGAMGLGACLRQSVRKKTTIIGYQGPATLSRGKCKKARALLSNSWTFQAKPRQGVWWGREVAHRRDCAPAIRLLAQSEALRLPGVSWQGDPACRRALPYASHEKWY